MKPISKFLFLSILELRMREADRDRQKREWEMKERQAEEQRTREEELRRRQQEEMTLRIRKQEEELHRRQQENNLFMQVRLYLIQYSPSLARRPAKVMGFFTKFWKTWKSLRIFQPDCSNPVNFFKDSKNNIKVSKYSSLPLIVVITYRDLPDSL